MCQADAMEKIPPTVVGKEKQFSEKRIILTNIFLNEADEN
jgi:hypothetical protein